jgi:hypothetical protein
LTVTGDFLLQGGDIRTKQKPSAFNNARQSRDEFVVKGSVIAVNIQKWDVDIAVGHLTTFRGQEMYENRAATGENIGRARVSPSKLARHAIRELAFQAMSGQVSFRAGAASRNRRIANRGKSRRFDPLWRQAWTTRR